MIDHIEVYPVVVRALQALISKGAHFTAFTVTQAVRKELGDNEIPHSGLVRPSVHAIMAALHATGGAVTASGKNYAMSLVSEPFPSPAWVYHPDGETPGLEKSALPEMIEVESTAIAEVGFVMDKHSTTAGTLWVTFTSGNTYRFNGVPVAHFVGLLNADSKGGYYNQNIKQYGSTTGQ